MAENAIRDILLDILAHTNKLGIFEKVKITGTDTETVIETVDEEKTVILKGVTNNPEPDFADATIGLRRMDVLSGFLGVFKEETDTVQVVNETRNGVDSPTEIEFVREDGTNANYRFMLADIINQQLKEIKFKGATYDIEFQPTTKNLQDLNVFERILGGANGESFFSPRTEDGKLYFYVGDEGGDRTKILINDAPGGTLTHEFKWPLKIVLNILQLPSAKTTISINGKGLLQIQIDSGMAEYTYLLPSKGQ